MNTNYKKVVEFGETSSFRGWDRGETVGMSKDSCLQCMGVGLIRGLGRGKMVPCNCVLRNIFRACYSRFRKCADQAKHMTHVRLEMIGHGANSSQTYGRKSEEYCADFTLVAKRTLTEDEYRLFKFHFLLGADYVLCCRQLKMEKGVFFHAVYRIQQKLGRAFRELQPYSLFPLDEYFGGRVEGRKIEATVIPINRRSLRPPLLKVA